MAKPRFMKRFARGFVSAVCAGTLVASQCGIAYAAEGDGDWSYPIQTSVTEIDKNVVTFGSQGDIWGEILGFNDIARNMTSDFNADGSPSAEGVANDIVVNLFGGSINKNPNPYYANLIYNANAEAADQVDHYSFSDKSGLGTGIDRADTALVDAYGNVSATMSYRPDIVMGNCATSWQDPGAITLRDGGAAVSVSNYDLAVSAGYDAQVNTIRSLAKDSEYYQAGDENYNPFYVENLSMYGDVIDTDSLDAYINGGDLNVTAGPATIGTTYLQMYNLVKAYEGVKAQNADVTTRYGDPKTIAEQYEAYGRGLQDYVLSKISDKTVAKKKVAVVSGIDTEANTVTLYKSSPSDTVQGTGGSFSGSFKPMEALENVTDNIAGTWSTEDYSLWWGAKNYNVTTVLEDITKLKDADYIIMASSGMEANLLTVTAAAGIAEEDLPPVFSTYATSTDRGIPGFPMLRTDGLEREAELIGFVYPEVVNPVYALAYYYTQFYHVKDDTTTLSNVLNYNIENMSLPEGVTGDLSAYNDSIIEEKLAEGLKYYAANKSTIDAASPKLTLTSSFQADVNALIAQVDELGTVTSTSQAEKVTAATKAYNDLTTYEKLIVPASTLKSLESAEGMAQTLDELTTELAQAKADAQQANDAADAAKAEAKTANEAATAANAEAVAAKADAAAANAEAAAAKAEAATANEAAAAAKAEADTANAKVEELLKQIESMGASIEAMKVTTVTVNAKKVTADAISEAITAAGGDPAFVTKVVVGKKASKIAAKALKSFGNVSSVQVNSTKLKKASVKNSLKGSQVDTVKVPAKKLKAYSKIFAKANCGKNVNVIAA